MTAYQVVHNITHQRFELMIDGHLAVLDYKLETDVISFVRTKVPDALGGMGLGSVLAKTGLDYARENNFRVIPICPFVKAYIQRHKEYADLVKS